MASDQNLIKGARDVAMGAANSVQAGGAGANMIFGTAMQGMAEQKAKVEAETVELKKRSNALKDKFHSDMEANSSSAQGLSEQHYKQTKNFVEGLKMDYDRCGLRDEGCKREVMMEMNAQTNNMNSQKETRKQNQETFDQGLLSDSLSDEQKQIMGIYMNPNANEYELTTSTKDGENIYKMQVGTGQFEGEGDDRVEIMEDREYTEGDITKLFNKTKDNVGGKVASDFGVTNYNSGVDGEEFDPVATAAKFNGLITNENLHSFSNDDLGFGSFKQDLIVKGGLIDKTLVAENPEIMAMEGTKGTGDGDNWYDVIDDNDREMIANEILNGNHEDLNKKLVVDYYSTMTKKQNEKGLLARKTSQEAAENEARRKEAIRQETRTDKYNLAYSKLNKKKEKDIQEENTSNLINEANNSGPISDKTYQAIDGRVTTDGKPGYVRMDGGKAYIYSGYPNTEDYKILQPLSDDPVKRHQQIYSVFGLPPQHMNTASASGGAGPASVPTKEESDFEELFEEITNDGKFIEPNSQDGMDQGPGMQGNLVPPVVIKK